ncbi:MAG: hypothetical protein Q9194_002505 [Teloschistes cf. exilis]
MKLCTQRCWKFKKRNGEIIIVRDVIEKIIARLEKFVAVGDAAMQYDPVHAAPAWGAFRFILQFAEDKQVARIKTVDSQISKVIEVFTIEIQTETAKEIAAMRHLLNSLDQPIRRMVDRSGISATVIQSVNMSDYFTSFRLYHTPVTKNGILSSESLVQYLDWRNKSSSSIFLLHGLLGSGKTLLASVVVNSFLEENSRQTAPAPFAYFYCTENSAKPERSSPDEIMRSILRQLTVSDGPSPTIDEKVLREFNTRQAESNVDGFEMRKLQTADCVRIIIDITASSPATIVIDAADEIPRSSRHVLLAALSQTVRVSLNVVKILVTSRDDSNIHALLPDAMAVRVQDFHIKHDLEHVVQREVALAIENRRMLNGNVSDDLKQTVTSVLIAGAGDMLASIDGIQTLVASKMREFVFDEGDISLTFVDWMGYISRLTKKMPNDHALAKYLHTLIHSGGSPLFTACIFGLSPILDELASAAECGWHQRNDLGQSGLYLAAATGHEMIVQLFLEHRINVNTECSGRFGYALHAACFGGHLSVVKTLLNYGAESKHGQQNALENAILADHEDVALTLLLGSGFVTPDQAKFDSMLQQAAEAGFAEFGSSRCKTLEVTLFNSRIGVVDGYMRGPGKEMAKDAVAAAGAGGRDSMIQYLIKRGLDLNEEGLLETPLRAASVMGHESTVRLLLGLGACLRNSGSFGEPLKAAAMRGHESITKVLLSHGAPVNSQGGLYGTALQAAAHRGHTKVVEVLLDNGADPYHRGISRDTTHAASEDGHEEIVQLLLERGFQPKDTTALIIAGLKAACENRHEEVVNRLSSRREHGRDLVLCWLKKHPVLDLAKALEAAVSREQNGLSIIEAIIEALPPVSSTESCVAPALTKALTFFDGYKLLLQMACVVGDQDCVELLLRRGINLGSTGCYSGGTALQATPFDGYLIVDDPLIDDGCCYGTALQAASRVGNLEMVEKYLNAGADIDVVSGAHGTALRAAVLGGHEDIALLVAAANMTADCLSTACKEGDTSTVQLLLAGGADAQMIGFKQEHDRCEEEHVATPLHAACAAGHPSVVRLLLDNGAGVNMEVIHGYRATPLIAAVRANHVSLVRLLLDNLADANHTVSQTSFSTPLLNAWATVEKTALVKACNVRQSMVMQILEHLSGSSHEADICSEAPSEMMSADNTAAICLLLERISTPSFDLLRQACSAGVLEAVKMLVKAGIDVNGHDGTDAPLLHVAASHSRPDIVRFLLDEGANVILRSPKYGSPLIAALDGCIAPLLRLPESCQSLAVQLPLPGPLYFDTYRERRDCGFENILQCSQIVQHLLDAGAETDNIISRFGNALHLASYMGIQDIVRLLLQRMADVNIFGGYSERGHPATVELLLDRGIEVNRLSPEHSTALHRACAHGNMTMIQTLMNHHADINAQNNKDKSILVVALSSDVGKTREREMLGLLLRYTTKARITEHDLLALVDVRVLFEHENLMERLLEHDASTEATKAVILKALDQVNISHICPKDVVQWPKDALAKFEADARDKWLRMMREHKPYKLQVDVYDNSDKTGLRRRLKTRYS